MKREPFRFSFFEAICLLTPLLLAPVVWLIHPKFVGASYRYLGMIFELFGFFASVAIVCVCYLKLKQGYEPSRVLVLFVLSSVLLVLISEVFAPKYDYMCYERAARAIITHQGMYASQLSHCYFYPPLYAQILAGLYGLLTGFGIAGDKAWHIVYFLHYASHFYFALLIWLALVRIMVACGTDVAGAEVIAALFLLLNTAFYRNFVFHQLNLATLALALWAVLLAGSLPAVSGLLLATGIGFKLLPLFLLIPLFFTRRHRAIAWCLVWGACILATSVALNSQAWLDYMGHTLPPNKPFYRNLSPVAILSVIFDFAYPKMLVYTDAIARAYASAWFVASVVLLVSLKRRGGRVFDEAGAWGFYGLALAIAPLGSPQIWPHQAITALPLAVWLFASSNRPFRELVPIALTFGFPPFDVFPLSYYRLVGLLWLIVRGYSAVRSENAPPELNAAPEPAQTEAQRR